MLTATLVHLPSYGLLLFPQPTSSLDREPQHRTSRNQCSISASWSNRRIKWVTLYDPSGTMRLLPARRSIHSLLLTFLSHSRYATPPPSRSNLATSPAHHVIFTRVATTSCLSHTRFLPFLSRRNPIRDRRFRRRTSKDRPHLRRRPHQLDHHPRSRWCCRPSRR